MAGSSEISSSENTPNMGVTFYGNDPTIVRQLSFPSMVSNQIDAKFVQQVLINTITSLRTKLTTNAQGALNIENSGVTTAFIVQVENQVYVVGGAASVYKYSAKSKTLEQISKEKHPVTIAGDPSLKTAPVEVACETVEDDDYLIIGSPQFYEHVSKSDVEKTIKANKQRAPNEIASALIGQAPQHVSTAVQVVKVKKTKPGQVNLCGIRTGYGDRAHAYSMSFADKLPQCITEEIYKKIETPALQNPQANMSKKIDSHEFEDANSDMRRADLSITQQLFAKTYPKAVKLGDFDAYEKEQKLLLAPIDLQNAGDASLKKALEEIKNLGNHPTEIIIPVIENHGHIKTLHLQITWNGNSISNCNAMYYDSKPFINNNRYPSNTVQSTVFQTLGSLTWQDKNPNWVLDPHQPLTNESDSGYWAYTWCRALFDPKEKREINFDTDYVTEDEIKLLYIFNALQNMISSHDAQQNHFILAAQSLYDSLRIAPKSNERRTPTIHILYELMLLSDKTNKAQLIEQTQLLFEGKASLEQIQNYPDFGQKYDQSWTQTLIGALFILAGLALLALTIFSLVTTAGGATLILPVVGEVSKQLLCGIGCALGAVSTPVGMYNAYRGYKGHYATDELSESLAKEQVLSRLGFGK